MGEESGAHEDMVPDVGGEMQKSTFPKHTASILFQETTSRAVENLEGQTEAWWCYHIKVL